MGYAEPWEDERLWFNTGIPIKPSQRRSSASPVFMSRGSVHILSFLLVYSSVYFHLLHPFPTSPGSSRWVEFGSLDTPGECLMPVSFSHSCLEFTFMICDRYTWTYINLHTSAYIIDFLDSPKAWPFRFDSHPSLTGRSELTLSALSWSLSRAWAEGWAAWVKEPQ